jgi:CRISPR-associated protein (TIGR03984 family)
MSFTLFIHESQSDAPLDVVTQLAKSTKSTAFGMAYAPSTFTTFRITANGDVETLSQEGIPANFYDLLVCSPDWELRASRDGEQFNICIRSEIDLPQQWKSTEQLLYAEVLNREYLLWGDQNPKFEEGWADLQSARIGKLSVPAPAGAMKEKLALSAIEYIQRSDHHANAAVIGQRFTGLLWTKGDA